MKKIADFFRSISEDISKLIIYTRTLRELSQLSDRELKDLGIQREMIPSIASEVYYDNR